MTFGFEHIVLVGLICWLIYAIFVWIRGVVHRWRLPQPTLAQGQLEMSQGQAFRAICRQAQQPGVHVAMNDYFAERGWNRADAMHILAEPLKHKLIKVKGWRFGGYSVTRKGWSEYRDKFIWTGGDGVNISVKDGNLVANVNSPHASAHGGYGNRAGALEIPHQRLIDALRADADADTATPDEAVRAREYADDLASAVDAQDADRTTRVLGRINALLASASAAFTLTRELLPPGS
ncbi:hypothetical protein [Streptomyces sp. NPDC026092]|uniref:hypothetical protein n=1 Tax=Streptomyces sp. NPDC026092 TaxID=3154797 RepID=UPI0033F13CA5